MLTDWLEFLRRNLPENVRMQILPVERMQALDYEWFPGNREEVMMLITKAPIYILEGLGFLRASKLPDAYNDSLKEIYSLIGNDHDLLLFPGEWYDVIPVELQVIDIFANSFQFDPKSSDRQTRGGCLSFGIPVPLSGR